MEIFGFSIHIGYVVLGIMAAFAVFFVFGCWVLSKEGNERRDPKTHWQPDVDQTKAEAVRNYIPLGRDR